MQTTSCLLLLRPLQDEIAPFFSCIYKMLHQQLLSFDIHAFSWGVYGGCILAPFSNLYPPTFNRCLFTLLRTLLHFFALAQNSTLFFSSNSALFHKNTRGWGIPAVLTHLLPCLLASMPLASAHPARSKGHESRDVGRQLLFSRSAYSASLRYIFLSFVSSLFNFQLSAVNSPALHYWFFFWRKPHDDTG